MLLYHFTYSRSWYSSLRTGYLLKEHGLAATVQIRWDNLSLLEAPLWQAA